MGVESRFHRYVLGPACVLSLACAENRQRQQVDRARGKVESLQQYEVPRDYREQSDPPAIDEIAFAGGKRVEVTVAPEARVVADAEPRRHQAPQARSR